MPSSYTLNLGIEKPADGEQDSVWGDTVNENMDILDRAINGQVTLTLTGTSSTLTTSYGALANGQYKMLVLAGTPSGTHTITIAPNDAQKIYFVQNNTAQSVIFTQGSGGNVTVATNDSAIIYANGIGATARVQNITDNFAFNSVKITGGTIDGTVIGGTTPAAISGTTGLFSNGVGVGTTDLSAGKLTVNLTGSGGNSLFVTNTDGTYNPYLQVQHSSAGVKLFNSSTAGGASNNLIFGNGSTSETMRIDAAGNLGLGAVPSAWGGGEKAIQVGNAALSTTGSAGDALLRANAYYNGTNSIYMTTEGASLYKQYGGIHSWLTAPSGTAGSPITFTQAMKLDASGNLLVGTETTPVGSGNVALQASISRAIGFNLQSRFTNDGCSVAEYGMTFGTTGSSVVHHSGYDGLRFHTQNTERMRIDAAGNLSVGSATGNRAGVNRGISVEGASTSTLESNINGSRAGFIYSDASNTVVGEFRNGHLAFKTNDTERARIDPSGNLLVGTTSGSWHQISKSGTYALTVDNQSTNSNVLLISGTSGSNAQDKVVFSNGGTAVGTIYTTASTTAYNTSSDYRLKENVAPMQNALDTIAQLNPVTYNWKADGSDGQGFIAHELQAVVPDCVSGAKDAVDDEGNPQYQGVDTSFLVATLVKAIQELKAEVDDLRAQLNP